MMLSHLLNSGRVGVVDKDFRNIERIFKQWKDLGFLDGIKDEELAIKVAAAYEIAIFMLLTEQKMADMYYKLTDINVDTDEVQSRVGRVIFPIIRRVITAYPKAHKYVDEIVGMTKGYTTVHKKLSKN